MNKCHFHPKPMVTTGNPHLICCHPSSSARPSSSQITNRSFTYASPYLWNQLPSSFRSLSPWFTFILCISPHLSHHLRSHHLSLPRPFTPDLKLISFTNPFLNSHSYSFRTVGLTVGLLKGHWRCLF